MRLTTTEGPWRSGSARKTSALLPWPSSRTSRYLPSAVLPSIRKSPCGRPARPESYANLVRFSPFGKRVARIAPCNSGYQIQLRQLWLYRIPAIFDHRLPSLAVPENHPAGIDAARREVRGIRRAGVGLNGHSLPVGRGEQYQFAKGWISMDLKPTHRGSMRQLR